MTPDTKIISTSSIISGFVLVNGLKILITCSITGFDLIIIFNFNRLRIPDVLQKDQSSFFSF